MSYENFTELDFEKRKASLRRFLESQNEFTDYDFDGSVLSTQLDLLAYNSLLDAYTVNMAANERFLSTAQRRESVAAAAAGLGYVPKSSSGATAVIKLSVTPTDPTAKSITIPAYTEFSARGGDETWTFYTTERSTLRQSTNGALTGDLAITEGKHFRHRYQIDRVRQPLQIPHRDVDISSLRVFVYDSSFEQQGVQYYRMDSAVQVTPNSNVYGLEERNDSRYYFMFGDGVVGKRVDSGQVVSIDYLAVNGDTPNGAASFSLADSIEGADSVQIVQVIQKATGGSERETIESIKRSAPAFYQRQFRTVTEADYAQVVTDVLDGIRDVTAWGGERNDPPAYGRVFISAITSEMASLSQRQRRHLTSIIDERYNPAGIWPQIVDPQLKYVTFDTKVTFDPAVADLTRGGIQDIIDALDNLNETEVGLFGHRLLYSTVIDTINKTNRAIIGNYTTVNLNLSPQTIATLIAQRQLKFNQALIDGSIRTDTFKYKGYSNVFIADDPNDEDDLANLHIYRSTSTGGQIIIQREIGNVRYSTGELQFTNVDVFENSSLNDVNVKFIATPKQPDAIPTFNEIILVDTANSNLTIVNELTGYETGDSA